MIKRDRCLHKNYTFIEMYNDGSRLYRCLDCGKKVKNLDEVD